ncbi:MAG: PAS domain-containing protein [Deltaproteobacteria bacterium]|nr:PAS domain-containing protein [Deltaproteobacteria bacterium]
MTEPILAGDPSISVLVDACRRLARRADDEVREDAVLQAFADVVRDAFPGLLVSIRLLDAAHRLSLVYATGRLRPEMRERLLWSEAPAAGEADAAALVEAGLARGEGYLPVFADGVGGLGLPLLDGRTVLGLLNVEWTDPAGPSPAVRDALRALAGHLAAVLGGSRLYAEVAQLRGRVDKLLDHADAPIFVLDPQRRVRLVNRCLARLVGRTRAEASGRDFLELLPREEQARFKSVFAAAVRGRPATNFELRLPRAGGTGFVSLAFNIAPVGGTGGEGVDEVVAVGQDMTEIHRLQRQMLHTEKLATIGQLAAGVVHEINNPLTSVSIHADYLARLMEREHRAQQEVSFINRIREAVARILRFTQDLMNFARPAGDEPEQIDLGAVLDQSAAFCEHVIAGAGVTLERRFAAAPRVYGIRGQLQQVFINLITNACHAMSGVERDRKLTLTVADNGDGRVRAEVRDTGAGIPAEIREQIFEPFFTTKREGEGTGLGLSIVRNIVDKHQGEIRVDSEVGAGSCFTLLFYSA